MPISTRETNFSSDELVFVVVGTTVTSSVASVDSDTLVIEDVEVAVVTEIMVVLFSVEVTMVHGLVIRSSSLAVTPMTSFCVLISLT